MSKKLFRQSRRSGQFPCDVCGKIHLLVEHHIQGRDVDDANGRWNLAWICPNCHDELHTGELILEGWFTTTAGRELIWHRRGEEPKLKDGMLAPLYSMTG